MKNKQLERIRECHLEFAERRGFDKTFCPSEVARELFPQGWREKMEAVRKVADDLCKEGYLVVSQQSQVLKELPSEAIGPIRLQKKFGN